MKIYIVFAGDNYYPSAYGGDIRSIHYKYHSAKQKEQELIDSKEYDWVSVTEIDDKELTFENNV